MKQINFISCQQQLGFYLAGLIEGDGYFGPKKLEIAFHIKIISSAYLMQTYVGYGNVH